MGPTAALEMIRRASSWASAGPPTVTFPVYDMAASVSERGQDRERTAAGGEAGAGGAAREPADEGGGGAGHHDPGAVVSSAVPAAPVLGTQVEGRQVLVAGEPAG